MNDQGGAYSRVRQLAEQARDLTGEIADAESRTAELKRQLNSIVTNSLVEAMVTEEVTSITLPASGNRPALELELGNSFHANISKGWDEERRAAGFAALPDDLVKVTVTVYFEKGQREYAVDLRRELHERGYTTMIDQEVHFATLTAWLRQKFEDGEELPDLPTIGATIVPRVKITEAT